MLNQAVKNIVLLFVLLALPTATLAEPLKIIGDDDFPPFSFKAEDGSLVGSDINVLAELEKRLGIEFEIELAPWKRLLLLTEQGKVAGSFALFDTPERREFSHFTHPVHYSTYRLFTKKGHSLDFNSIEDLYHKRIGIQAGFATHPELEEAVKSGHIKFIQVFSHNDLFKRLTSGALDAIIGNKHVVQYKLKHEFKHLADDIEMGPAVQESRGAYLVLSKRSDIENLDDLQKKIKTTLEEMEKEGVTQKIIDQFMTGQ